MLPGLQSGLSTIRAAQVGLDVTSNNLANANTEGYHRQRVHLADAQPVNVRGLWIGTGVEVSHLSRVYDGVLENQLNDQIALQGANKAYLQTAQQVESIVSGGSGAINESLGSFFNALTELTQNPSSTPLRREVIDSAANVAGELNRISGSLNELSSGATQAAQDLVDRANGLAANIEALTAEIVQAESRGAQPNDLLDQRDQLVTELSGIVNVKLDDQGRLLYAANDRWLIGTQRGDRLQLVETPEGLMLGVDDSGTPFLPTGGELGGMLSSTNGLIADQQAALTDFASRFAHAVNELHAQGLQIGESGHESVTTTIPQLNITVPLQTLPLVPPIEPGSLYVGITNKLTGERETTRLDIDPAAQSWQDVVSQIDGIAHLQASIDPANGLTTISADSGYEFDFTNQVATYPDMSSMTGTSVPEFSGQPTGNQNGLLQLNIRGTGNVGQSADLKVDVFDQAGRKLSTLNVGNGYAAGDPLTLPNGLTVKFSAGTLNNGDTALIETNAVPDTSGILGHLAPQPFFTNATADALQVNPELLRHPEQLATSGTGRPGSITPLTNLLDLRDEKLMPGNMNLEEFVASWQSDVGRNVQQATDQVENVQATVDNLKQQRDALSGVNPDEELVRLLDFQRMYQAGAQVIRVIQETQDELMQIIR